MTGYKIFANHRLGRGPARPVIPQLPPRLAVVSPWSSSAVSKATETAILEVLDTSYGGPLGEAFRRKEADLAALFSTLSSSEARLLVRRLTDPRPGDPIATRFARLVPDRRQRLLDVLDSRGAQP
jgi:hypothetical protein